jgi:Tfp pilus assembly ATPase PilU
MTDLLTLAVSENADGLSLRSGRPPVIQVQGEAHSVEGPAMMPENAYLLLRDLAGSRNMREFRERGAAAFILNFKDWAQFQVRAKLEHNEIQIDVHRVRV